MATEHKAKTTTNKSNKRRQRYLPQNKPVKKKGAYPLRPGVQGFFITCDGGRERQASHEALNVIDSFYEELVHGNDSGVKLTGLPNKPLNKKITFSYSSDDDDKEEEDDNEEGEEEKEKVEEEGDKSDACKDDNANNEEPQDHNLDNACHGKQTEENANDNKEDDENQTNETQGPPAKKQCLEIDAAKNDTNDKTEEKSIDKLIEAELEELGDKNKRRFFNLDAGCNGLVFVQMRKRDGDPGPKDIVQHMMTSAASTRKHMSRFILRVLPVEVACYASEDEISKAIKPLVDCYFPVETQSPQKFAVLYEARANTGIDRMRIINTVAKSITGPHKVDLSNPDKTIVVEIVKTVCLIGVVEKYKELAKYNLRQLTSPKQ